MVQASVPGERHVEKCPIEARDYSGRPGTVAPEVTPDKNHRRGDLGALAVPAVVPVGGGDVFHDVVRG